MAIAKKTYTYYDAEQRLLERIINGGIGDKMGAASALKDLRQANSQMPIVSDKPKTPVKVDSTGPAYFPKGDPNGWHSRQGGIAAPATNEYSHPVPTNEYAHKTYDQLLSEVVRDGMAAAIRPNRKR